MQTVSVLVALFLFESVFHTSAYNASLFIKLLELQLEECPAVSFCTFRSPNLSVESRLATCCRNCSCDADCVEQGTCCPDIQLTTFIGEEVSNNISELSDRIKSTNVTIGMQLQQPESEPRNKQENLPCVQANALTNIIIHTKRENAYRMIDSCPKTYMDNLEIARKCTDGKYQDIGFNDPNIYIPVTSMQTKTSYQNIFCYWCNEETQATNSLRQWKVKMFCSYGEYSHSCDNPYGCFRQVNRISKAYCEISFEPRADVQPHVSRCDPIDVQTCPNHSDVQLREVCRAFHLPVFAQDVFITFKRYKNIACYLCNREEMFKSYCAGSLSEREGYDLELNFQLDENDIIMSYNETEQHVLNVSIVQEEGFQCPTGFLQNSERCGLPIIQTVDNMQLLMDCTLSIIDASMYNLVRHHLRMSLNCFSLYLLFCCFCCCCCCCDYS